MCNTMAPPTLSRINYGTEQSKTDWAEEKRVIEGWREENRKGEIKKKTEKVT